MLGAVIVVIVAAWGCAMALRLIDTIEDQQDYHKSAPQLMHPTTESKTFYLKMNQDMVEIYTEDGRLYDYAGIKMELLPPEILEELKTGMYIRGEEDLYDFLQAYSS